MKSTITRRNLVALAAAALPAGAQAPTVPQNADEELQAARAQWKANAAQIAKVKLPAATEPAVHFKA